MTASSLPREEVLPFCAEWPDSLFLGTFEQRPKKMRELAILLLGEGIPGGSPVQKHVPVSCQCSQIYLFSILPLQALFPRLSSHCLPFWFGRWEVVMSLGGGRKREARLFLPLTSPLGGTSSSVCASSVVRGGPTWPAVQVLPSFLPLPGASAIVQLLPGSPTW